MSKGSVVFTMVRLATAALAMSCARVTGERVGEAGGTSRLDDADADLCDVEGAREVEISLDRIPEVVRVTALREAKGRPIAEVKELQTDGSTFYQMEWMDAGEEVEILVGGDGAVLCRTGESADDDDDELK